MTVARDACWGPAQVHALAVREAFEAITASGFLVTLEEPDLPLHAPEGESKDLARRRKQEGDLSVWRGDPYLLLPEVSQLVDVCVSIREDLGFSMLYDLAGCDLSVDAANLQVVYGFLNLSKKQRLVLLTEVPKAQLHLPSVAEVFPAADWHEREAAEMYGLVFDGHPDPRALLLPEDWEGFPLRKDYVFPEEYGGIPWA